MSFFFFAYRPILSGPLASALHASDSAFPHRQENTASHPPPSPYLPQQVDGGVGGAPRADVARERERRRRAGEDALRVEVADVDLDGGVVLGGDELVGPRAGVVLRVGIEGEERGWEDDDGEQREEEKAAAADARCFFLLFLIIPRPQSPHYRSRIARFSIAKAHRRRQRALSEKGRANQTAEQVESRGRASHQKQPPSDRSRRRRRRSRELLAALSLSSESDERRDAPAGEESYSPLARDVEVDDLALVVDHGGFWEVLKKKRRGERRKEEDCERDEAGEDRKSFRAAAPLHFFFRLKGRRSLSLLCSLSLDAERVSQSLEESFIALSTHQQREPFYSNQKQQLAVRKKKTKNHARDGARRLLRALSVRLRGRRRLRGTFGEQRLVQR